MQVSGEVIVIVVAAVLLLWLILAFNGLVALRNRVQNAWADIDVQLNRRHDLIPNLVETARGYMEHERSVFEAVSEARAQAVAAGGNVAQRSIAESTLTAVLGKLLVVAENYPQLRAVENFRILEEELTSTENRIAYARQFYNDEVRKYNTRQVTFPRNLVAPLLGFSPATMFAATDSERAEVPVTI